MQSDLPAADTETAFHNRPEFKALDASLRTAGMTTESARAGRLPTIGFNGAFNYGKPGLDLLKNKWMHYFTGGISLNWNLWDWGTVNRDVEKAEIARKKTEKTVEDLKLAVARQMTEALAGYNEARQRVSLAQQSAEYAKRHLELVGASFKNGVATERDYDTAHALYTKSLYDAAASRIAGEISRAQVEYVLGIRYRGEKP
jgi:outer membrane protein TolC